MAPRSRLIIGALRLWAAPDYVTEIYYSYDGLDFDEVNEFVNVNYEISFVGKDYYDADVNM